MWKKVLAVQTFCHDQADTVAYIGSGKTFERPLGGMAAVTNTGNDSNWTGHDFAAVNWYGFGRLAWNPNLIADEIAHEWIVLTFGQDTVVNTVIL